MRAEYRILGPVEVVVDGRPVSLTRKPLVLLACLLVRANTDVPVDVLADALWDGDDDAPADAKRTLQTYVMRLRRALGAGAITTTSTGYRLDADAESLDLLRFRALADHERLNRWPGVAGSCPEPVVRWPPVQDCSWSAGSPGTSGLLGGCPLRR